MYTQKPPPIYERVHDLNISCLGGMAPTEVGHSINTYEERVGSGFDKNNSKTSIKCVVSEITLRLIFYYQKPMQSLPIPTQLVGLVQPHTLKVTL